MAFNVLPQGSRLLWIALVLVVLAFLLKMYQARRVFWRLRQQGIVCDLTNPAPQLGTDGISLSSHGIPYGATSGFSLVYLEIFQVESVRDTYRLNFVGAFPN